MHGTVVSRIRMHVSMHATKIVAWLLMLCVRTYTSIARTVPQVPSALLLGFKYFRVLFLSLQVP